MRRLSGGSMAARILMIFVALVWAQTAAAQETGTPANQMEWKFMLTPYFWLADMGGTAGVMGTEIDLDVKFSDLIDFVDIGGSIRFEAWKGRWGGFIDVTYLRLSEDTDTPSGVLDLVFRQSLIEGGAGYRLKDDLGLIFGLRYFKLDADLDIPGVLSVDDSKDWSNGFVGLQFNPALSENWNLLLRGDVGSGDSDFQWNAHVGAGYRFNEKWSLAFAYRYFADDFEEGGFKWDVDTSGLGLGMVIEW